MSIKPTYQTETGEIVEWHPEFKEYRIWAKFPGGVKSKPFKGNLGNLKEHQSTPVPGPKPQSLTRPVPKGNRGGIQPLPPQTPKVFTPPKAIQGFIRGDAICKMLGIRDKAFIEYREEYGFPPIPIDEALGRFYRTKGFLQWLFGGSSRRVPARPRSTNMEHYELKRKWVFEIVKEVLDQCVIENCVSEDGIPYQILSHDPRMYIFGKETDRVAQPGEPDYPDLPAEINKKTITLKQKETENGKDRDGNSNGGQLKRFVVRAGIS